MYRSYYTPCIKSIQILLFYNIFNNILTPNIFTDSNSFFL